MGNTSACLFFLLLPAVLATTMGAALSIGTHLDIGLLATNAFGFVLLLATFAAVGLFASSVTRQPIVAAVLTLGILLGSWMASLANPDPTSLVQMISITRRFESFNAGMIDSADIVWHAAVIAAFLALSIPAAGSRSFGRTGSMTPARRNRLRHMAHNGLFVVLVVVLTALIAVVARQHAVQWDLTSSGRKPALASLSGCVAQGRRPHRRDGIRDAARPASW